MFQLKFFDINHLIVFFIPALLFTVVNCNEPPKEPATFDSAASDPKAIAIAEEVIEASGGLENWHKTRYVAWRWLDKRLNVWDKWTGDIRVASKISIVIMNLNTRKGIAWKTGTEITDADELQRALDYGYETWMNDSYWVFMPFKLKDPGVILKYIGEGEIEGSPVDILSVTFKNVGKTPENKYDIYVDKESKLLVWWDYYMDATDETPRFKMPWKNYQRYGDIWLSDDRGLRKHTDLAVFEELPASVFESFERVDLTKLIEQQAL